MWSAGCLDLSFLSEKLSCPCERKMSASKMVKIFIREEQKIITFIMESENFVENTISNQLWKDCLDCSIT